MVIRDKAASIIFMFMCMSNQASFFFLQHPCKGAGNNILKFHTKMHKAPVNPLLAFVSWTFHSHLCSNKTRIWLQWVSFWFRKLSFFHRTSSAGRAVLEGENRDDLAGGARAALRPSSALAWLRCWNGCTCRKLIWHFSKSQSMLHTFQIPLLPHCPTAFNRTCATYSGKTGNCCGDHHIPYHANLF